MPKLLRLGRDHLNVAATPKGFFKSLRLARGPRHKKVLVADDVPTHHRHGEQDEHDANDDTGGVGNEIPNVQLASGGGCEPACRKKSMHVDGLIDATDGVSAALYQGQARRWGTPCQKTLAALHFREVFLWTFPYICAEGTMNKSAARAV